MYLPDDKGVIRKKHSILTYQMENRRKGCINRDNNSVNNMISILKQYLKDRSRPVHFRRGVDLEELKKIGNPEIKFDRIISIRMYHV